MRAPCPSLLPLLPALNRHPLAHIQGTVITHASAHVMKTRGIEGVPSAGRLQAQLQARLQVRVPQMKPSRMDAPVGTCARVGLAALGCMQAL